MAASRGLVWTGAALPYNVLNLTTWRCSKGHEFSLRYASLQEARGCPVCSGRKHHDLADYQQLAARHGIEFVGPVPLTSRHATVWRLPDGRVFETPYRNLNIRRLSLKHWLEHLPDLGSSDLQASRLVRFPLEIRALLAEQEQDAVEAGDMPVSTRSTLSAETGQELDGEQMLEPAPASADATLLLLAFSGSLSSAVPPAAAQTSHARRSPGGVIEGAVACFQGSSFFSPLLSAAFLDLSAGPSEERQRD